jgi:ABC-type Fe3+/spermidine/putrescine transport system ATPase subunit
VAKQISPLPLSGARPVAPSAANDPNALASVEIDALGKSFGTVTALQGVTLRVERGEFVSFLGPSGCGKTTLLRIIAGLDVPTSGDVRIAGRSVVRDPPYRRNIGLVFQSYALFPHKSVAANVDFGLRHRTGLTARERGAAIDEALTLVRLREYRERKPSELSGGQQQRVALARAVVTHPEVLLLDEPLSNLDAKLREEMRVELKELHRALSMTFIYVTHDRVEALSMSDRIVVMRDGHVDQIGTPRQVFEEPASIEVARFMGHGNLLRGEVIGADDGFAQVRIEGDATVAASARHWRRDSPRVWLLIRNNAIALHQAHAVTREGLLRARVRSVFYHGLHVEAHVELTSGAVLRVELPAHLQPHLEHGAEMDVQILQAGTWILQREE